MATSDRITQTWVPSLNKHVFFQSREKMRSGRTMRFARSNTALPMPTLPVDWAKNLTFPIDGNDRYGDCMVAAAAHADNTFTGNNGTESTFDTNSLIQWYLNLAGGDNGLDEGTLVTGWKQGLVNDPKASILDALDIDVTNPSVVQPLIQLFGGVLFMLSVPNAWINNFSSSGGAVWDAPARPNPMNGHGVWWNGVDSQGRYKLQTWGSYVWITPAGVDACDPSGFIVFSLRWFDPKTGLAPNGKSYDELAALWVQLGGHALPPNPFPHPQTKPATVSLSVSPTSVTVGSPVSVSAAVAAVNAADGTPTGSVNFNSNGTTVGSASLTNGVAATSLSNLGLGANSLVANYAGDTNFAPSASSATTVTVTDVPPPPPSGLTVTLTSSASSVQVGAAVTLSAKVVGATGSPTGTVDFLDGTTSLGSGTLSPDPTIGNGAGTSLSVSFSQAGSHSLTAKYSGDATHAATTSSAISLVVNGTPPPPPTSGVTVTYDPATATVVIGPVTVASKSVGLESVGAVPWAQIVQILIAILQQLFPPSPTPTPAPTEQQFDEVKRQLHAECSNRGINITAVPWAEIVQIILAILQALNPPKP